MMLWASFRLWAFWLRGRWLGVCVCCHFLLGTYLVLFQWEPGSGHQAATGGSERTPQACRLTLTNGRRLTLWGSRPGAL